VRVITSADACQHQAWQAQPLAVSPALVLHGLVEHALAGWGWLEQQVYPTQAASVSVMVGMHNKMVWAAPAGEVRRKCWGQASVIGRFNSFSCLMTRNTSHGECAWPKQHKECQQLLFMGGAFWDVCLRPVQSATQSRCMLESCCVIREGLVRMLALAWRPA
jgi:hypothetical protein